MPSFWRSWGTHTLSDSMDALAVGKIGDTQLLRQHACPLSGEVGGTHTLSDSMEALAVGKMGTRNF